MFLQEECFINIIKDLILSENGADFVAMTSRNGFTINIVSNFVIRHISVCPSNSWCLFQVPLFI